MTRERRTTVTFVACLFGLPTLFVIVWGVLLASSFAPVWGLAHEASQLGTLYGAYDRRPLYPR
jgi:hypothetical protein